MDRHKQTLTQVEQILRDALNPSQLVLEDHSHQHAGHGDPDKGGNFSAEICSEKFVGLNPLERQRLVFSLLGELMDGPIHALSMKCRTPDQ